MIVCVRREDKVTHYYEGFQRYGKTFYFVVERESFPMLTNELPMKGTLMSEEQFEEKFYVPNN